MRAWQALSTYPFLGNVREFAHAIQHAVVLSQGQDHRPRAPPRRHREGCGERDVRGSARCAPLSVVLKQAEREHLLKALAMTGGKRTQAAELLGISRKNLWEKLRAHGVSDSDVDDPVS